MQTVLNNPLAEPYTLGVASGAALGAAVFHTLGWSVGLFGLNAGAVVGALLVLFLLLKLVFKNDLRFDSVILLGVMISFFFKPACDLDGLGESSGSSECDFLAFRRFVESGTDSVVDSSCAKLHFFHLFQSLF